MRYTIPNLHPGTRYAIRVRSKSGAVVSDWSRNFEFTTAGDSSPPNTPTNVVGSVAGTSFRLSWNAVTHSADGTAAGDLDRYEVRVTSNGVSQESIASTRDTKYDFTLNNNIGTFGAPRATVELSVRAVDAAGNSSPYSTPISLSNPAPVAPTGLIGAGRVDGLTFSWTASPDNDLKTYKIYSGTTSATQNTLVWSGMATNAIVSSVDYTTNKWYKVVAVDVFNSESPGSNVVGPIKPLSSFSVDTVAPDIPTGLTATLTNSPDGKSASAAVQWNAVTDPDNDLADYTVAYRQKATPVNDWQYTKVPATSTTIQNLVPFVDYDFKVASSDFSANMSNFSVMVTATSQANTAPSAPTGLNMVAGRDNLQISWNENSEPDVKNNAGAYIVTVATNSGFTTGVLTYRTAGTSISINGLNTGTTYYAKVAAVDSQGMTSSPSSSASATTTTFPTTQPTDGNAPSAAPTGMNAQGGVGFIFASWNSVTNNDPLIYEVFMSTTSNFTTYDATTKVADASGTSIVIENTAAGTPVAYGTTYYIKVRPKDRDGIGPVSSQVSASPSKISGSDIASDTSLITNLFIGSGGSIQSTGYIAGTKGFKLSNTGLTIEGSDNLISASALKAGTITGSVINIGAGGVLNVDATGSIKSNNYVQNASGYKLSNTGLEINDGSIDAKALKTDSAIIGNLVMGRSADANGSISSFGYVAESTGWKINKSGIEINEGSVSAAALKIQSGQNLLPSEYASFQYLPTFYTNKFAKVNADFYVATDGGRFGTQYLVFRARTAAASSIRFGAPPNTYNIPVDGGDKYILSAYVRGSSVTSVISLLLEYNDATMSPMSPVTVNAGSTWQRISTSVTVPSTVNSARLVVYSTTATVDAGVDVDCPQVEKQISSSTAPSAWAPSGITSIAGEAIRTGSIISNSSVMVNGVSQPSWSINMTGGAQFGDAAVRGKMVVGVAGQQDLAPINNFDTNITGYQAYSIAASSVVAARTTTAGEVISGTGSLKVTGNMTEDGSLGIYFGLSTAPTSTSLSLSFKVALTDTANNIALRAELVGAGGVTRQTVELGVISGDGSTRNISNILVATPSGAPVTGMRIYASGLAVSTSKIIFDDISVKTDQDLGQSYIMSGQYVEGVSGWKINPSFAEFNSGVFRGSLDVGGTLSSSVNIIAGDKLGDHAELSYDGFRAYVRAPDASVNEAVRIGTSGDAISIVNNVIGDPTLGTLEKKTVASISQDGAGSFRALSVDEDPILKGRPLLGLRGDGADAVSYSNYGSGRNLDTDPIGIVEGYSRGTTQWYQYHTDAIGGTIPAGGYMQMFEMSFDLEPGRQYEFMMKPLLFTTTSSGTLAAIVYVTFDGSMPTVNSQRLVHEYKSIHSSGYLSLNPSGGFINGITNSQEQLRVLVCAWSFSTTAKVVEGFYQTAGIKDLGPVKVPAGRTIGSIVDVIGNATPPSRPPAPKSYVKEYRSTAYGAYRSNGFKRTDAGSTVYQGMSSPTSINGDQYGVWMFPSMLADLSGSTVTKVEIYLYANHWWYSDGGTAIIKFHDLTALPSGGTISTVGSAPVLQSSGWPKPGGRWITLPSSTYNQFKSGAIRGIVVGKAGTSDKRYYGGFNGVGAIIKVYYTK